MPQARIRSTRRVFALGLALFIGGVGAVAVVSLWKLHRDTLQNGYAVAALHARAFEDHLTQSLQVVDMTTSGIAGSHDRDAPALLGEHLFAALHHAPYLRSLALLDADDRIVASSNPANVGRRVASADFLPHAAANLPVLRIGAPWSGRDFADGHPVATDEATTGIASADNHFIPVLRPLPGGKRPLRLLAALNADYFINHVSRNLDERLGSTRVLRYDGVLLLSSTGDALGRVPAASVHPLLAERDFGSLAQTLPDGTHVLTAWRASQHYPLVAVAHLDRDAVLQGWTQGARMAAGVLLTVIAVVSAITLLLYRRQMRVIAQEAEIDRQRRMTSTVFEASNDIIIITDADAAILSINPAFSRVTGYSAAEALGRNPRMLSSGRQDTAFYREMWRRITENGWWQGEIVNRRKDGGLIVNWVTVTAVRDPGGQLLHYIGVLADITERKQREDELRIAKEQAEVAAQAKSRFLATMSHEIRTPMNGIIGMTDLALMSAPDAEMRGYLEMVKSSASALMGVLADVLDYSRIDAGHLTLERLPFSLGETVGACVALFQPQAREKQLDLHLEIAPALPDLATGDPLRLRQIVTNLVSNAIKFTPAGEVVVRLAADPQEARNVVIEVRDSGIGIPADKLEAIFDPFVQADDTVTRTYGGSGLGLSICRQLIRLMHGRLDVASEPGRGTRFTVRLPLFAPAEDGHAAENSGATTGENAEAAAVQATTR